VAVADQKLGYPLHTSPTDDLDVPIPSSFIRELFVDGTRLLD
jgi:hypothetical protein